MALYKDDRGPLRGASLVSFHMCQLPTTYSGHDAGRIKETRFTAQMGPNGGLSTHLWVCPILKETLTRSSIRHPNTYTIFEGTSEIQRLIIARAISGVQIR